MVPERCESLSDAFLHSKALNEVIADMEEISINVRPNDPYQ